MTQPKDATPITKEERPAPAVIANDLEFAKRKDWPAFTITVAHADAVLCRLADLESAFSRALAQLERANEEYLRHIHHTKLREEIDAFLAEHSGGPAAPVPQPREESET